MGGNFELLPLLIWATNNENKVIEYNQNHDIWFGYDSIYYQFALIFIVWISSLIPFYIKYMLRFGEYFNPNKHCNHFLIALYYRTYIIFSILFKVFNIYLCSLYILN